MKKVIRNLYHPEVLHWWSFVCLRTYTYVFFLIKTSSFYDNALFLFSLINIYLSLAIFYNLNLNFNDCMLFCYTDALQLSEAVPNNIKVV